MNFAKLINNIGLWPLDNINTCKLRSNIMLSFQTTTSLNSTCTDGFTGTSAATPLVSGVIALVLQAK